MLLLLLSHGRCNECPGMSQTWLLGLTAAAYRQITDSCSAHGSACLYIRSMKPSDGWIAAAVTASHTDRQNPDTRCICSCCTVCVCSCSDALKWAEKSLELMSAVAELPRMHPALEPHVNLVMELKQKTGVSTKPQTLNMCVSMEMLKLSRC
jgi:hypothetical protein